MSIASSGCLKLPDQGALGRIRIWGQTLECAALFRELCHIMTKKHLIKAWNLPEEIAVAVAEQHFPDYSGKHALYIKLIALANRLLQNQALVDGCPYVDTVTLMEYLGKNELESETAQERIRGCQSEFHTLAKNLAA